METIKISPRFFRKELDNYGDWYQAFWRELFQNSVDAGCSTIRIAVRDHGDGLISTIFDDDGPGMSLKTLRDVYFNLGETGKDGVSSIGGHGRARILTCFAHERYQIRTQSSLCSGEGGSYEIAEQAYYHGCAVSVWMKESATSMRSRLSNFLNMCDIKQEVFLDGQPMTCRLKVGRARRRLSFGSVHLTEEYSNRLIVRVRGVVMFTRYIGFDGGVVVEVNPSKALETLQLSRDSLKQEAQLELDQFIQSINVDKRSIRRNALDNREEWYGSGRRSRLAVSEACPVSGAYVASTTPPGVLSPMLSLKEAAEAGTLMRVLAPQADVVCSATDHGYGVLYENANARLVAASKAFLPDRISGNRLKMLKAWAAVVEWVVAKAEKLWGTEILFLPGLVFSPEAHGMRAGRDVNMICINPLGNDLKLQYTHRSLGAMYGIALHECAHIPERFHDEDYAARLTELTIGTAEEMTDLKRWIAKCLKH
jgi:hypothetical protein